MPILNLCPSCGGVGCYKCEGFGSTPYPEDEEDEEDECEEEEEE